MTDRRPSDIEQAWNTFCDQLKDAGRSLGRQTTPNDELTRAEGLRHLSRLVRMALESSMEHADPDFPAIAQLVTETRKFGCDNPDTIYQTAVLNGAHAYRITGTRGTVSYLSLMTTKGPRGQVERTGFIDSDTLHVDEDGSFEITLSAERAPGNWLPMEEATTSLGIRQTLLDRRTEVAATLHIERLGQATAPAPLHFDDVVARLESAAGFVNYCATLFTDWTESYQAHPNELPPADQEACIRAGLDPNIYFYRSYWQLAPDEALLVHIPQIPSCDTWNLQVDNYWQESMDYRYFRSHVNKHTARYNDDGSVSIVIAHDDPGHPNWLSTAGHRLGHLGMRYVRAERLVAPQTRLCRFEDVATALAALEGR